MLDNPSQLKEVRGKVAEKAAELNEKFKERPAAISALITWATDPNIHFYLLWLGADQALRNAEHAVRLALNHDTKPKPQLKSVVPGKQFARAAGYLRISAYELRLPFKCDRKLGDATLADLKKAEQIERKNVGAFRRRANFWRKIRDVMIKKGATAVREACPEPTLRKWWREAGIEQAA